MSFKYRFAENNESKYDIIKKLKEYNETHHDLRLQNFKAHFEVLNELLEALMKDKDLSEEIRDYCSKLLNESIIRENDQRLNNALSQIPSLYNDFNFSNSVFVVPSSNQYSIKKSS